MSAPAPARVRRRVMPVLPDRSRIAQRAREAAIGIHHVSRSNSSLGKPFTISTVSRLTEITRCSNFSG